jgi:hypothetical protein
MGMERNFRAGRKAGQAGRHVFCSGLFGNQGDGSNALDHPVSQSVELEAPKTLLLSIDMENENAHPWARFISAKPLEKLFRESPNCAVA